MGYLVGANGEAVRHRSHCNPLVVKAETMWARLINALLGVWTGPKAAAWMSATLGHAVHPQRGWEALRRLGWTSKGPRPRHAQADPAAQVACKKTSRA
jgi:transposase